MSIDGRTDKESVVNHGIVLSLLKKIKIMPFAAAWMQLEIIILSEISQIEKDKYWMVSLICGM